MDAPRRRVTATPAHTVSEGSALAFGRQTSQLHESLEIEENLSRPHRLRPRPAEFAYASTAYGLPKNSITRLRSGS